MNRLTNNPSRAKNEINVVSRLFVATPFIVNGLGIVSQKSTADALAKASFPRQAIPGMVAAARVLEVTAGSSLALGKFSRQSTSALMIFLSVATLDGHPFWKERKGSAREKSKAAFFVNVGLFGALLHLYLTSGREPT